MLPQGNIFDEETKIEISIIDSSLTPKQNKTSNDSSMFFESSSKRAFKNEESNSSMIIDNECKTRKDDNTKDVTLDDIVPIPDINVNRPTSTMTHESLPDEAENSDDASNQCPICLKTVSFTKYLSHMKSCAAKNKLSTQQLLSALKLHKRQIAERKELGLGVPVQSYKARVSPKRSRTNERKGPADSSLQLALALSASLHSAQEDEVIQEAEALKEAGLCEEAEQKLSTLEKYGFAPALPLQPKHAAGGSRSRPLPPSLLLRRNQEERERIITEKVAIILISEEESVNLASFALREPVLKSKELKEKWDNNCKLWSKAHCAENEKREAFYVKPLSQFVSPSKCEVGESLKRLSQLAGRLNTPMKEDTSDPPTPFKSFTEMEETDISDLPTPRRSRVKGGRGKFDLSTQTHKTSESSILNSLSEDWRKLVNNYVLSDIKIQCKGGVVIPAHKLVLHVRCPSILNELLNKSNDQSVLDWERFSVNSVLAFVEFLYCARKDRIVVMDANELEGVKSLADRFDCTELKSYLRGANMIVGESQKKTEKVKKNLFKPEETCINSAASIIVENYSSDQRLVSDSSFSERLARNNCELIPPVTHSRLNSENVSNGRESPDMFEDLSFIETQQEREDLDILVSLMGKSSQTKVDSNEKTTHFESNEIMPIDSPQNSSADEVCPGKRKASNTSFSEDENISLTKKRCSDLSTNVFLEGKNTEETFDLTQSSNSSNEQVLEKRNYKINSLEGLEKDLSQSINSGNNNREDTFDLTQSSKSSDNDVCVTNESNRKVMNNQEESDGDDVIDLTQKCNESIPSNCSKSPTTNEDFIEPIWDGYQHKDCDISVKTPTDLPAKNMRDVTSVSTPQSNKSEISVSEKSSLCCGESLEDQLPHSPLNTSGRKQQDDILLGDNNVEDYIDPVWDGFDDYYDFNCGNNSFETPQKYQKEKYVDQKSSSSSVEKFKSKQFHASPKNYATDNSSGSKSQREFCRTPTSPVIKSPNNVTVVSLGSTSPRTASQTKLTPQSSASIKYVSSDSKSPKFLSQKVLTSYSSMSENSSKTSHHNLTGSESDDKLSPKKSSSQSLVYLKTDFQKSRKNLSSQFESDSNCSKKDYSEYNFKNSSDNSEAHPALNSGAISLRKDSLAAMQRLLDDSFEVNESLFNTADVIASGSNKKEKTDEMVARHSKSSSDRDKAIDGTFRSKTSVDTPSPEIVVSDKVTPQPDYSGMKTPVLKKELSRFGLKPSLGRQKAKLLLRYIYDQTHPVVPDSTSRVEVFKRPEGQPPRSPVKGPKTIQASVISPRKSKAATVSPRKTQTIIDLDDSGSELDELSSQRSTSSSVSSCTSLPEESFHEAEDILTQDLSDSGDVRSCIRSLIVTDPELHRKVLMYEPIYLEHLMALLKASGIRSKVNDVMDFLDEQCITFRTNSWKTTNEKRRQKQKSPKKKLKPHTSGSSPSKERTQVSKKRGRPKKTV